MASTQTLSEPASQPADQKSFSPNQRSKRWVVNFRLLLVTFVIVSLLTPALYGWHAWQMRGNAEAFLIRASDLERDAEYGKAADELFRYLKLHPDDAAVRIRLAKTFGKAARSRNEKSRAAQLFAAAIGVAPDQPELRSEHMQLLLELGDYSTALSKAEEFLEVYPQDPAALRIKALGRNIRWRVNAVGDAASVTAALEEANIADPGDAELALELARLYRSKLGSVPEDERNRRADAVMAALVESSPKKAEAYLTRFAYRQEFGFSGAEEDLDRAAEADSDKHNLRVQMAAGGLALQKKQWDRAIAAFQAVVAKEPANARGYMGLAQAYREQGDDERAIETLKAGAEKAGPKEFELQFQMAATHLRAGRPRDADKILQSLEPQITKFLGREQNELLIRLFGMQAQLRLMQQDPAGAVPLLRRVLQSAQAIADTAQQLTFKAQVLTELGNCYRALQQWDQAAATYQQAAELQPKVPEYRLNSARAWHAAGRVEDSAKQFALATSMDPVNVLAWIDYATVLLQQQAALPSSGRNWKLLESALAEAKGLAPEDPALMLLEADYEMMQGRSGNTAKLLQQIEEQPNLSPANARRLAIAYERTGNAAAANRIYKQLQAQATPATVLDTLFLGVDLLANRKELEKAEQLITSSLSKLGGPERLLAQYRLADLLMAGGQRERAQALLLDMVQRSPREARALQQLLDLALATTESAQLDRWITQLKGLEGPDGTLWRFYRAQLLLREVLEQPKAENVKAKVAEARQLQSEIQKLRPTWALGSLLLARMYQLPGAADDPLATEAYQQAVRLGDKQVRTYEELLSLLYRQGRIADAANYLEHLQGAGNLSPSLTTLSLAIDARQGNFARAIESARQYVSREPDRADARLQLGQLLLMDRTRSADEQKAALAEAEREFELATQLAPANVDAWSMRLALYIGTQRTDAAREMLTKLQESSKFQANDRALFLAQSYAMLGDAAQAQKWYRQAVENGADRADIQRDAAKFFSGFDSALAEQCARKALQLDPADKEARRLLATLLIDRGGQAEELAEVWKLIDSSVQGGDSTDLRLEAIFLLRRGGVDNRSRAKTILEELIADGGNVAPIDRLLLAQIYEAEGGADAARELLLVLVSRKDPAPAHLAAYAELLLRSDRAPESVAVIDQLAAIEPEAASLRTLSLRVQSLKALKDDSKVSQVLEAFLKKNLTSATPPAEQVQLLLAVGNLCAAAELAKPAENCFRRALKLEPAAYSGLARWLANTDRIHESIEVCIAAAQHDKTAEPAISLISFMLTRKLSEADRSLAEGFLKQMLQAHPKDGRLLQAMGTMRLLEGQRADAVKYLRETLAVDPRNLDALNNLALLLSEDPSTQAESIRYIDQALAIAGASPELLDSKGWILLKQHQLDQAAAMFLEALSLPPGDPRHRFHLAVVYHLQGKRTEAKESLAAALENKLPVELLSPEERDQLAKLETELK